MEVFIYSSHILFIGLFCWYLINEVLTLQILKFNGKVIQTKSKSISMLTCKSTHVLSECSVDFLHNNASVESLRYSNDGCYSTDRLCDPSICSCEENCKSFSWNVSTTSVTKDDSFSCVGRVHYNKTYFRIHRTLICNGTDFISPTTFNISLNRISKSNIQTSSSPKTSNNKSTTVFMIIISVVGAIIAIVFVTVWVVCCLKRDINGTKYKVLMDL